MPLFLLATLIAAFGISLLACGLALRIFPNFRSRERKEGVFRADQSLGDSDALTLPNKKKRPLSTELPLVGSRGILPAMLIAGGLTGWLMGFDAQQWTLLGTLGIGLVGFWLVGFLDDWRKVHSGQGLREITKFMGIAVVAFGVALLFLFFIDKSGMAYSPYSDVPGLGSVLRRLAFAWPIFFVLLFMTVSTSSSLAADFTDGLDGLAGGVTFSAALAYAVINLSENEPRHYPLTVAALALAGATLGYLPWNWPSSWKGRGARMPRSARLIMGDSGSLALGGLLALIALADRQEISLVLVAGVFVLEGLSAVIQSRLLVKFFRRFLRVERFHAGNVWFPHTEFPLPFLATPMHHHFDLLGWDRKRLVYGAWTVAAIFGILGIASSLAPFTWERYLARGVAVIIAIALWQSGQVTRGYFIGTLPRGTQQNLALFYGYPYRLFGRPLYAIVERVEVDLEHITNPAERNTLWVRTNVFDARATLGYFCYRAGMLALAREQWERIPYKNLVVRPQIQSLLTATRERLEGITTFSEDDSAGTIETAMGAEPSPADSTVMARSPGMQALFMPTSVPITMPVAAPSDQVAANVVTESAAEGEAARHATRVPLGHVTAPLLNLASPIETEVVPPPQFERVFTPLEESTAPMELPPSYSGVGVKGPNESDIRFREGWPEV